MGTLVLATELNFVGKLIYDYLYQWVLGWGSNFELIGAFGITVILFTIFLKILVLPMDVWQKTLSRKNTLKMEIMKPALDKAAKQCGENKELLMQKQRAIYKEHGYSAFSACLPSLISLAIFMVVFSGFNSAVKFENSTTFDELSAVYDAAYESAVTEYTADGSYASTEVVVMAVESAEAAVLEAYEPEKFLLTKNIFMSDTWANPIPTVSDYTGTGLGKLGITDMDSTTYNRVMGVIEEYYNYNEDGDSVWNGYLILPILSFLLSIVSTRLIKQPEQPAVAGQTEEQQKAQQNQTKMMTYMMPLMMGVFALFYSTAFTLYMVVSNLFSTTFNLLFNLVTKKKDAEAKDKRLSTTIK
ncbi:MAG: membrane protein insertase YidC [Bacillota bacterium]